MKEEIIDISGVGINPIIIKELQKVKTNDDLHSIIYDVLIFAGNKLVENNFQLNRRQAMLMMEHLVVVKIYFQALAYVKSDNPTIIAYNIAENLETFDRKTKEASKFILEKLEKLASTIG